MNVWKDLYYNCIDDELDMQSRIIDLQKEIKKLEQKRIENKEFFLKEFHFPLDKCMGMSYNDYQRSVEK